MRLWLREQIVRCRWSCGCSSARWWSWASGTGKWSFPATRICSAPSRCISRITFACLCGDAGARQAAAAGIAGAGSTSARWAAARWPARRCRSIVSWWRTCSGLWTARGRPHVTQNSMDAVSDRDFAVGVLQQSRRCSAVHLSRLAEDLVLWSSAEFNFIRIADAYTTGSSLMPQKKNPDVAELHARQESPALSATWSPCYAAQRPAHDLQPRPAGGQGAAVRHERHGAHACAFARRCSATLPLTGPGLPGAASDPALLATDLADYLVRKGLPFRQAHHTVGALVAAAEGLRKPLSQLTLAEFRAVEKRFAPDVLKVFDLRSAMSRRETTGAPGTREVQKQLARWRKLLD